MEAGPKLVETFGQRWTELGLAETALQHPPHLTLTPKQAAERSDTARLPKISLSFVGGAEALPNIERASARADLEVHGMIGEGGMGRVHAARQHSLAREVAIKTLKRDLPAPAAVAALLREALITGSLEHPGIVPVHALGVDDRDMPVLVMKRVEGVEWRQLLHDPDHPAWASRPGDRLSVHLEVLMQVCQAVSFAHSRGIVHRDIKPENVMLGDFGEVYLVDWGIAVRSDDPAVTEGATGLVGTPAYMAPEMIAGRPVSARTDVYLLGAVLHEILTGEFRHPGASLQEVLLSAFCSERVAYAPNVPEELARCANRAMARDPEQRFASAIELRQAIADFLRHQAAILLADEASERLISLEQILSSTAPDVPPVELDRAYRLATESRFGFVQALRGWPNNTAAEQGLGACIEALVELELRQGHVETAVALLCELSAPSERLEKSIARARRRAERAELEQERLRALAHDLDARVAGKQRARGLAIVAGASLAVSAFALSQPNPTRLRPLALLAFAVVVLVMMSATAFALRRSLMQNAFNRRLVGLGLVVGFSLVASRAVGTVVGMPAPLVLTQDLLVLSALAAAASVTLPWIWLLVPVLLGGVAACVIWPGSSVLVFGAAVMLAPPLVALALWKHHRRQELELAEAAPESVEVSSRSLDRIRLE
jgi:eukaryotic-like serine/threonine-protein kinase